MSEGTPRVSFGVPVRNGADTIGRCLESILSQDFRDFEVIVSDNCSTDATCRRVEEFTNRDPRVRLLRQSENQGLIENFNTVAREAKGEFFRWLGADDWLEPEYTSTCLSALDTHPEAIVATSGFDLVDPEGTSIGREYAGEFLESQRSPRRLARLFWFFHAGLGVYEPNYSLIRREALLASGLLQIHRQCDWLFSTQLCLMGRFVHVPNRLFHRGWSNPDGATLARLASRLHPVPHPALEPSVLRLYLGLAQVVARATLPIGEALACQAIVLRFSVAVLGRRLKTGIRRFRRSLGITRARFTRPSGSPRSS